VKVTVEQILRDARHHVAKGWITGYEFIVGDPDNPEQANDISNDTLGRIRTLAKESKGVRVCAYGGIVLARGLAKNSTPSHTNVKASPGFLGAVLLLALCIDPKQTRDSIDEWKQYSHPKSHLYLSSWRVYNGDSVVRDLVHRLDDIITTYNDRQEDLGPVLDKFDEAIQIAVQLTKEGVLA
jgi:hypothetical protein